MEKDAEKVKWIKYLNDFAYEQDGEYGQGRITPEDVYEKIMQARSEGYEKGREEEYEKSIIDMRIVVEEAAKQHTLGWNEAIEAAVKVALGSCEENECSQWGECQCSPDEIASKIEALRKG